MKSSHSPFVKMEVERMGSRESLDLRKSTVSIPSTFAIASLSYLLPLFEPDTLRIGKLSVTGEDICLHSLLSMFAFTLCFHRELCSIPSNWFLPAFSLAQHLRSLFCKLSSQPSSTSSSPRLDPSSALLCGFDKVPDPSGPTASFSLSLDAISSTK